MRTGAIDALRLLTNHFQVVIFSRETQEDSYCVDKGGRDIKFYEQNKQIKQWLKHHYDLRIDGYYTSLIAVKQ